MFVTLVVCFLVVDLALWVELTYEPAVWVHFVLWPPLTLLTLLPLLRALKGATIGQQFASSAAEGRVVYRDEG